MPNRDYDRDYDRRNRSRLYEEDDMSNERSIREPIDRDYSASRRGYSDRGSEGYSPRSRRRESDYADYAGSNVTITTPKSFMDVQEMIDHLRRNEAVIVDLEGVEEESAQRILDFLSGAAYGLGGSMRRVKESQSTFLVTPQGTGIKDNDGGRNSR